MRLCAVLLRSVRRSHRKCASAHARAQGDCEARESINSAYTCKPPAASPTGNASAPGNASESVCISPYESGVCAVPTGVQDTYNGCPVPQVRR